MRALLPALLLTACMGGSTPQAPTETPSSLQVVALSQPVGWLAEQLVGDDGQVTVMVPAGEDPPHWRPAPEAIASLDDADLVIASGAGYEPWIATASLPRDRFVDTAKGLDLLERPGVTHSHGEAGSHHHGATDPHVWMDPLLYLAQAQAIHRRLVQQRTDDRADFDTRLEGLRDRIMKVHETLQAQLAGLDARTLAANHPSYDYLARRYGFSVQTIAIDPDAAPDDEAVGVVAGWATAHAEDQPLAPVMIWESSPTDALRSALPEGLDHLVVDPVEQAVDGRYAWDERILASATALHSLVPATPGK